MLVGGPEHHINPIGSILGINGTTVLIVMTLIHSIQISKTSTELLCLVELGNYSNLTVLELRDNQLSSWIPLEISRLTNLAELNLGQNALSCQIPKQIFDCFSLVMLLLDQNQLFEDIPEGLSILSITLNASNKNMEGMIPAMLGLHFDNLTWFSSNPDLCGRLLEASYKDGKRRRLRQCS
ncbi:hypothetical protein Taro_009566 [Colocasia esculenta]|uniref:Uncharacterized protein n=1 Tax=Colocasia esculenta TaxID=4460 RepID=A0A843U0I6_COLES|nr:hypothetical protein [Colocasia esculenta]